MCVIIHQGSVCHHTSRPMVCCLALIDSVGSMSGQCNMVVRVSVIIHEGAEDERREGNRGSNRRELMSTYTKVHRGANPVRYI